MINKLLLFWLVQKCIIDVDGYFGLNVIYFISTNLQQVTYIHIKKNAANT